MKITMQTSMKLKDYLPKGVIDFCDQPIDPDINWYEEIRKLTTGQGKYYIMGCLSAQKLL